MNRANPFNFFKKNKDHYRCHFLNRYWRYTVEFLSGGIGPYYQLRDYGDDNFGLLDYLFPPMLLSQVRTSNFTLFKYLYIFLTLANLIKVLVAVCISVIIAPIAMPIIGIYHFKVSKERKKLEALIGDLYVISEGFKLIDLSQDPRENLPACLLSQDDNAYYAFFDRGIFKIKNGVIEATNVLSEASFQALNKPKSNVAIKKDVIREATWQERDFLRCHTPTTFFTPTNKPPENPETALYFQIKDVPYYFELPDRSIFFNVSQSEKFNGYSLGCFIRKVDGSQENSSVYIIPCSHNRKQLEAISALNAFNYIKHGPDITDYPSEKPLLPDLPEDNPWVKCLWEKYIWPKKVSPCFLATHLFEVNQRVNVKSDIVTSIDPLIHEILRMAGAETLSATDIKKACEAAKKMGFLSEPKSQEPSSDDTHKPGPPSPV